MLTRIFLRRALRPLERLAQLADQVVPGRNAHQFDTARLPREAAEYVLSINRLLVRHQELFRAQEKSITAAAHELRTPLHVMLLELGKIEDNGARQMEGDILGLSRTIDRIMCLSHLDTLGEFEPTPIDLRDIVERNIERLKPLIERRGCQFVTASDTLEMFDGDPQSVSETVCNLIEHLCNHAAKDAVINVTCGPGSRLVMESQTVVLDDPDIVELCAPFHRDTAEPERQNRGLRIIRQTVALHGGSIISSSKKACGTRIELRFN